MGVYLNSKSPFVLFQEDFAYTYFVDKSEIIAELVPLVEMEKNVVESSGNDRGKGYKYVCITRPCRFGKTLTANMISSYFCRGVDSGEFFQNTKISGCEWYKRHFLIYLSGNMKLSGMFSCFIPDI